MDASVRELLASLSEGDAFGAYYPSDLDGPEQRLRWTKPAWSHSRSHRTTVEDPADQLGPRRFT